MMSVTKIRDLMPARTVVMVRPEDTLDMAMQTMEWAELPQIPVVAHGKVVGLIAEHDLVGRADMTLPIRDAMTIPAPCVGPDDDLVVVAATMASRPFGCLPVVEDGRLVGIVTAADLLIILVDRLVRPRCDASATIDTAMTREPETASVSEDLLHAAVRMRQLGVRHLPVVHKGRLVGILSDRDARAALGGDGERLVGDVMTPKPLTLTPTATLEQAGRLLIDNRIGAAPVVDATDGRLVGILSYVDVIRASVAP